MSNPVSAERLKAEQMYRESKGTMKLVDIANHLGVTPSKVRKWKSLSNWDDSGKMPNSPKKKPVERSTSTKGNAPLKRKGSGAPYGNKNAVGKIGGAPIGNKRAEKHGIRSSVYWDFLEPDEYDLVEELTTEAAEEAALLETIALLAIRERRLMKKIKQFSEQEQNARGLMVAEVSRQETDRAMSKDSGTETVTTTRTVDNTELLIKAHAELTRVQKEKIRCVESLHRLRQSNQETKANTAANDWILALTGGEAYG